MRVFITGMEGFVGGHLAHYALEQGAQVYGTVYPGTPRDTLRHLRATRFYAVDIRHPHDLERRLGKIQPTRVFHLAGQSQVQGSDDRAEETLSSNVLGTLNLLEACRKLKPTPNIVLVTSAKLYGPLSGRDLPARETLAMRPQNAYAVSKACQDYLGAYYAHQLHMPVVRMRPFNHTGPRQSPLFVCSDFARQIARMERGQQKPILQVGNLQAGVDISDVRDVVRGYWLAAGHSRAGEVYNVCSGKPVRIREVVDVMQTLTRIPFRVQSQDTRRRGNEPSEFYGSYAKIKRQIGWQPKITLKQTLQDVLDYWRDQTAPVKKRGVSAS